MKQAHLCLPKLSLQAEAQSRRPRGTFSAPLLAFDRPAWYASAASSSCRPGAAKQACADGQFETARSAKGTALKITSLRRKSMSPASKQIRPFLAALLCSTHQVGCMSAFSRSQQLVSATSKCVTANPGGGATHCALWEQRSEHYEDALCNSGLQRTRLVVKGGHRS